ncbi:Nrap protein [Sporormia fimetaria CBS 119925]|uniref:U3 small nucleolar RNA-associated protein 22 n=1 Tax=Sporormia fimetaria CBS 119925 TaxID=1340428 RepID=A0A6A6VPE1_9PLEO|nr:Nrap protein [Sporormia fimetaria CBS 119925]
MAAPATKRRKLRHESEDGSALESEDTSMSRANPQEEQHAMSKAAPHKPHRTRPELPLQDGVYTAEVYKSNMFKLQVDELLEQVKFKYGKKVVPLENAMRTLKTLIEQFPNREPLPISEAEKLLRSQGVTVPFPSPRPPKDAKYRLEYAKPASINVTGSYALKVATRTEDVCSVDMVVVMPKSIFQEKDYLNYRYLYKRAYYLACVAAGLKNSSGSKFKLSFDCLNGSSLQPILIVDPSGDGGADDFSGSKCQVRILLAIPEGTFAEAKVRPTSNCIRPQDQSEGNATKALPPTPFYNATLQSDATMMPYLKLLHSASSKCDAFKDACVLGRIWLKQRGFGTRVRKGGFGNFEWAALMAILLHSKTGVGASPLSPGYSSYQLFKATLQFLAQHNLTKTPYVFQAGDVTIPKSTFAPILYDGPRNINLLYKMTQWSYTQLQAEAKASISTLGDSLADHFESTFIVKTNLLTYHYDAILRIPMASLELETESDSYEEAVLEKCRLLHSTIARALTDRITSLALLTPEEEPWKVGSAKPREDQRKSLFITIGTDPAFATRNIDLGPAAEDKQEAASFRKFWGEKAELRRFKDGSILESVVWTQKDASTSVLEQILRFVLSRHIGAGVAEMADFAYDTCSSLVHHGRIQGQSGVFPFTSRMNAFSSLEKDIRDFEGLPLQIRHIRAADPQLRYSSVDPESMKEPAALILQFEGSARWPDDLCAIQRTKVAFLLKITDLLAEEKPNYVARVGLENQSYPSQNQAYLDIILPTGFSFRLRIHHDREATLLERQLKDKSLDSQSREAAASGLAIYKRDFIQVPAHTQALQVLCTRFPALSPSIRLTKKWFATHLLLPHFSHELVELFVVNTFLQPHPWAIPSTATSGFTKTLLWLSRWDWRHTPLIVDFSTSVKQVAAEAEGPSSGTLSTEDIKTIQTRFEAWRRIDPGMNRVVLFAATNLDSDGTTWSDKGKPEKVMASRMTALARVATNALRRHEDKLLESLKGKELDEADTFRPGKLFSANVQDYDIVIRLSSKHTRSSKKKAEPKFKNLEMQQGPLAMEEKQNVGYNPAALLADDLRQIYGDAVIWFWNPDSVDVIAGLWNPVVTARRSWKVKPGWNSVPVSSQKKKEDEESGIDIELNKQAICNEIRRLGGDLILDIN